MSIVNHNKVTLDNPVDTGCNLSDEIIRELKDNADGVRKAEGVGGVASYKFALSVEKAVAFRCNGFWKVELHNSVPKLRCDSNNPPIMETVMSVTGLSKPTLSKHLTALRWWVTEKGRRNPTDTQEMREFNRYAHSGKKAWQAEFDPKYVHVRKEKTAKEYTNDLYRALNGLQKFVTPDGLLDIVYEHPGFKKALDNMMGHELEREETVEEAAAVAV